MKTITIICVILSSVCLTDVSSAASAKRPLAKRAPSRRATSMQKVRVQPRHNPRKLPARITVPAHKPSGTQGARIRKFFSAKSGQMKTKLANWRPKFVAKYKKNTKPRESLLRKLSSRRIRVTFTPGKAGVAVRKTQYRLGGFNKKRIVSNKKNAKKDLWKSWSQYWKKEFAR